LTIASIEGQSPAMRLKANNLQRAMVLAFMIGVGLWSTWPDWRLVAVVVLCGIAAGLYLLPGGRRETR
jgi:hypothetical protein